MLDRHNASASGMDTKRRCLAALKHLHRGEVRSFASLLLSRRLAVDTLVTFLVDERLGVFAYAAIRDGKLGALIPGPGGAALQDQWRQQQLRNVALLDELARIATAFQAAGIEFLLLKGLYLSEHFYHGRERRFTWDLDLLVRPSKVGCALSVLGGLGFATPRFTSPVHRLARLVTHALECRRDDGFSVDLHWSLRRLPGLRIDEDRIWSASHMQMLGEAHCRVPADEHSLLLLLLGIAADVDRSLCRTRSLWDVYMLMHGLPGFDWPGFLEARVPEGSIGLVANALSLVLHGLACHDEFPNLVQALSPHRRRITMSDPQQAWHVLSLPPHSLANHLAFARWQPLPRWSYAVWWTATLPLRMFFARRL